MSVMMMTALLCRHILTVNSHLRDCPGFFLVLLCFDLFCFHCKRLTRRRRLRGKKMCAGGVCEWVGSLVLPLQAWWATAATTTISTILQFPLAFYPKRRTTQASI